MIGRSSQRGPDGQTERGIEKREGALGPEEWRLVLREPEQQRRGGRHQRARVWDGANRREPGPALAGRRLSEPPRA